LLKFNLKDNQISTIQDDAFVFTEVSILLDLSFNRLTKINERTFYSLNSLRNLNLSGNQISSIAQDAFKWMSKIEKIDLFNNNLEYLDEKMLNKLLNYPKALIGDNCLYNNS
jgi:leucine-rich repeats and immunoglobulin-like domains protein 2